MWQLGSLLMLVALLCTNGALAAPVADLGYREVETTGSLEPWVSIIASGVRSTITPVITTIDGNPTTINAFPSPTTATSVGVIPDETATTTSPTSTSTGIGAFEICHNVDGEFAPLCPMPNNNTLYISETYYVTWDASYYSSNATVRVTANYNNATGGGPLAWESGEEQNSWGYVSLKIDKAWLQGSSSNNLTLFITSLETSSQGTHQTASLKGPTITITSRPYQPYTPPDPTKAPTGSDLYIALPCVAAFIFLVLCGSMVMNRKHGRIDLGNIMGRNRGYRPSSKKNRRKRMVLGPRGGNIELDNLRTGAGAYRDNSANWKDDDPFTDKPGTAKGLGLTMHHVRRPSEGLESLVSTPGEERDRRDDWIRPQPTRKKTVGDSGYVKESAKMIERHASGPIRPPIKL